MGVKRRIVSEAGVDKVRHDVAYRLSKGVGKTESSRTFEMVMEFWNRFFSEVLMYVSYFDTGRRASK